jgi:transcriptional repressor NrdR
MRCPFCRHADSRVIDSREVEDGQAIRRRRSCPECSRRFTTVEETVLSVVKRSGVTEPFSRTKVVDGVRRACQGRPVDEDALALLAQQVEEAVRATGCAEVPSQEVGLAILGPLRDLDEVAYLRFASVYRAYTSADDFLEEILALRSEHPRGAADAPEGDTPEEPRADGVRGDLDARVRQAVGHPPRPPVGVG